MERYRRIIPEFERLEEIAETVMPNDVRLNRLKTSREELERLLEGDDVGFSRRGWNDDFYRLDTEPGKTFAHWLGTYYVQESTSGIPPLALDPKPGERVLDMCAAPGSKTTQMAAMMENRGEILANDVSDGRMRALMANLYQTGCVNVQAVQYDGRNLPEDRQFDRVLVDAPCSGEGNLRSQEGMDQQSSRKERESLSELQEQLLEKAFRLCREGGTVVYSTCTFAPEENEMVVREFVEEHALTELSFDFPHSDGVTSWDGEELDPRLANCMRVYPHQLDSGGMFVARFEA
jgi:NOL1/NOP2/sun family putative RNA methylase